MPANGNVTHAVIFSTWFGCTHLPANGKQISSCLTADCLSKKLKSQKKKQGNISVAGLCPVMDLFKKKKVTIWCVSENQHWGLTDVLRESAVLCLIPSTHGQFSGVHFRHQKVVLSNNLPPLFHLKTVHLWF